MKKSWKLWKRKSGKKRKKSGKKSSLIFLSLFFFLIVFFALSVSPRDLRSKEKILFNLKEGSSASKTAELLREKGIISWEWAFLFWAKILKVERSLKPGYYELSPSFSILEILKRLTSGDIIKVKVTIPEGLTLEEMSEIFEKKLNISKEKFLSLSQNTKNLKGIEKYFSKVPLSLEGYLFPATYLLPINIKEEDLILLLVKTFFEKIYKEFPNFEKELKEKNLSFEDWVILASIVEKEGKFDDERPFIAGVFLNRLKEGYKLQSCATVEYVFKFKKPKLSYEDLKVESPYNTYIHYGLPPTPICSPSLSSLKAVLYPKGDYLFFVSKGNGRHYFTRTYKEHLEVQRENHE